MAIREGSEAKQVFRDELGMICSCSKLSDRVGQKEALEVIVIKLITQRSIKPVLLILISGISVFLFDRVRYNATYEMNRDFLNEAMQGGGFPDGSNEHFSLLITFSNLEVALYIALMCFGVFLLGVRTLFRSTTFSLFFSLLGVIAGHMISRVASIRGDFFLTYLVAAAAMIVIVTALHLVMKGKSDELN